MNEYCTCLSISRDPFCVHHGDIDKIQRPKKLAGQDHVLATHQDITATDLRQLAQYLLSAAKQLQDRTISQNAYGLLKEWHKAAEPLRQYVNEFPGSCADIATKRAMGMLTAPQLAKDAAAMECYRHLSGSDTLKEQLADAEWAQAGEAISSDVIHAYHVALEKGQS